LPSSTPRLPSSNVPKSVPTPTSSSSSIRRVVVNSNTNGRLEIIKSQTQNNGVQAQDILIPPSTAISYTPPPVSGNGKVSLPENYRKIGKPINPVEAVEIVGAV
jgi:hypothetical protein